MNPQFPGESPAYAGNGRASTGETNVIEKTIEAGMEIVTNNSSPLFQVASAAISNVTITSIAVINGTIVAVNSSGWTVGNSAVPGSIYTVETSAVSSGGIFGINLDGDGNYRIDGEKSFSSAPYRQRIITAIRLPIP